MAVARADDWDNQMLFFLEHGFRVIAHDRRGHGRSSQTATGNDMDTYASVARAKAGRVAKAVLVSAIPPVMLKSESNPGGLPVEAFDELRTALAANRSQFYIDVPSGPFYGFNRPGATVSQGLIDDWWRQGMMGSALAHYECITVFSETDFTEDLKRIDVPVLVAHGTDDQVVPCADSAVLSVKLLRNGAGRWR